MNPSPATAAKAHESSRLGSVDKAGGGRYTPTHCRRRWPVTARTRARRGGRRPVVFLDRDGTLVRDVGHLHRITDLRLLPGVGRGIRRLRRAGFAVVIVSNQSAVARGLLGERELARIHGCLARRLALRGATLDGVYYCPHHPSAGRRPYRRRCGCRKPRAGLLRRAARELGLDLSTAYMIGDHPRDVAAGRSVGARTVLLVPPRSAVRPAGSRPDHAASDFLGAVDWILQEAGLPSSRRRAARVRSVPVAARR